MIHQHIGRHPLLLSLIGSHAHGLNGPDSDIDLRGVYALETKHFFMLGPDGQAVERATSKVNGEQDDVDYEVGHFLRLATKSNPSVLEVFKAPRYKGTPDRYESMLGPELRALFKHVWSTKYVYDAFSGYGHAQRKKLVNDEYGKYHKFGAAWLRALYEARELITTGDFKINVTGSPIEDTLRRWKQKLSAADDSMLSHGEVITRCELEQARLDADFAGADMKTVHIEPVNDFLLMIRKEFWL